VCGEDNHEVILGKECYFITADGYLIPTRKDQPPPDPSFFNLTEK
jgi:hypothetical protein